MPLLVGNSNAVVSENVRSEIKAGRPQPQAIAIAMRKAGKPKMPKAPKALKPKLRKLSTVPSVKLKPLV